MVRIRAAALLLEHDGKIALLRRAPQVADGQCIDGQLVRIIVLLDLDLGAAACPLKRAVDGVHHALCESVELPLVTAACLEIQRAELCDDIRRRAARDLADVAGRLRIDASLRDGREHTSRRRDRVLSRLGVNAGVRRLADDAHRQLVLARCLKRRRPRVPVGIERIAKIRVEQRRIETARPVDPALLGDGKDDLQVAVRKILLLETA